MSDTDLAQYNGTPVFPSTADVGTAADPYLVPTDGPIVTAESNLSDEAPVNRALKEGRDWMLGLRRATIGDTGAARKTFKSIDVDGAGANASALTPGFVRATGDYISTAGDYHATIGSFIATTTSTDTLTAQADRVFWTGTTTLTTGANPPQGQTIKNELRAINTPKCAALISVTVGTVSLFTDGGYGVANASINSVNHHLLDVEFADNFTSIYYVVQAAAVDGVPGGGAPVLVVELTTARATNACQLAVWDLLADAYVNLNAIGGVLISLTVNGRQTT